jgi:hypothetical protein
MERTMPKAAQRPAPTARQSADRAAAWTALAKYATKEADRELLKPGEEIPIALDVTGHVNGHWFCEDVRGKLQIGFDQTAATSTGPDQAHLVAVPLEAMPKTRRRQLLDSLPAGYLKTKSLPIVAPETLSAAETLLERLRDRQTVTRKGNVRFEPQAG